jgi:hypothetical protein
LIFDFFFFFHICAGVCASKSTVSHSSTVVFNPGSYPSFTIGVRDIFGDPFPCSVASGCAVGGSLQLQNHVMLASSQCSPICSVLPLLSSSSGCCSSILSVPQDLMEDGIYNVSLFVSRGDQ